MKRTTRFGLIVIAIASCHSGFLRAQQVGPGVGADTEDPKRILREADQAIRKVQSLSYEATYQGTGSFSTCWNTSLTNHSSDNYPQLLSNTKAELQSTESYAMTKAYRVDTLPTVYVIGGDGKIIYRSIGVDDNLRSFLAKRFQPK